jgi:hypothetical protein
MLEVCARLAALMVILMIGVFFLTGVGQDPLQFVHPPEEYARLLLANPAALRTTLGLDNLFIAFYSATFVSAGLLCLRAGAPRGLVTAALALLLGLALLDLLENFHFLVMLSRAEQGAAPSAREIAFQVLESLVKFHVGYLGVFLFGFATPRHTLRGRILSNLSLFVQLPVGVMIYLVPRAIAVPLVFVRFSFFVAALVLISGLFAAPERREAIPAAAGSGAPA